MDRSSVEQWPKRGERDKTDTVKLQEPAVRHHCGHTYQATRNVLE